MLINMHKWEAVVGCSRDDVSLSLKGIIKVCWKQRIELPSFIALLRLSLKCCPNTMAMPVHWQLSKLGCTCSCKYRLILFWDLVLIMEKMAGYFIMVLINLLQLQRPNWSSYTLNTLCLNYIKNVDRNEIVVGFACTWSILFQCFGAPFR